VRRRRFSSGCKAHPAIAPAGNNRGGFVTATLSSQAEAYRGWCVELAGRLELKGNTIVIRDAEALWCFLAKSSFKEE
jgi:hypothetical protein